MGNSSTKEQPEAPVLYTEAETKRIQEWVKVCQSKDKEAFEKLLEQGNLDITENDLTPLHTCAGNPEFLEKLMNRNLPINRRVKHNMKTALHYAVDFGSLPSIEILLKNGADPTIKDDEGNTAYRLARERNNYPAIYLIRYHMLVNKQDEKLDIHNPKQVCRMESKKLDEMAIRNDPEAYQRYKKQYLKCISGAFCHGESERFLAKVLECEKQPEEKRDECAKEYFEFYQGCLFKHQQ